MGVTDSSELINEHWNNEKLKNKDRKRIATRRRKKKKN